MDLKSTSSAPAWVWVLCTGVLGLLTGFITLTVWHHTGGHWSYPLDDTYIHMALARNLAFFHNWGINHQDFGAASSSPLYTLLLAGLFKAFTIHICIPLLVNLVFAVVLLRVLQVALHREGLSALASLWVLLAVIVLTPLPILVVSGMEHVLQCLFSFLFVYSFARWMGSLTAPFSGPAAPAAPMPRFLPVWAFLMVATRYECLFLLGVAGLVLLFRRRLGPALALGFSGLLPVVLFGLYSMSKGSYFLPNSILLKSGTEQGAGSFVNGILVDKLTLSKQGITGIATQRLLFILPLVYLLFRQACKTTPRYGYFLLLCLGGTFLHLCLAATGWFYRYEAYLVLNATMITGILVLKYGRSAWNQAPALNRLAVVFLSLYLVFPLFLRSSAAFSKAPRACLNIFEQQYQMGLFLQRQDDHAAVGANDIGAISFLSDIHTLDLWGLGNIDVARSKRGHYWTPAFLDSLSRVRRVRVAVVYDSWFDPALLARWKRVGSWTIPQNVICGDSTVSFYAVDSTFSDSLRAQLHSFGPDLPSEVKTTYYP
ncbi:hypothetical protein [Dinghuibacter silviterrae]|uniref:4-amino-4-deoxy-L-arabinose transferase-like glycosyltransferase n=1 Tax=Dinghuibacter silviterrae TaxID=1539049 RepID=A0A4R8DU66_9BACT|nr:hypothetical protein [Dinghuibacter silviterrae]TDX01902.1 hypothetical protein EDB95_2947 [Dinghuibacter silviterrae]